MRFGRRRPDSRAPRLPDLPGSLHPNVTTHLRPFGGTAQRRSPTVELKALGRWKGEVRVVPIEHLKSVEFPNGRAFEVVAEWDGPPLPQGGARQPGNMPVHAIDCVMVAEHELARRVADAAAELLREPQIPFLRVLRESVARRGPAWRRNYEAQIGDDAKAAGEGY